MPRADFTQPITGGSTGVPRSLSACKRQATCTGSSQPGSTRGSTGSSGPAPGFERCEKVQQVVLTRMHDSEESFPRASADLVGLPQRFIVPLAFSSAEDTSAHERQEIVLQMQHEERVAASTSPEAAFREVDAPSLLISVNDIIPEEIVTYVPVMGAPASPAHSSTPCSPASSVVMSGACVTSAFCNVNSSCGVDSDATFSFVPVPASLHIASLSTGSTSSDHEECGHGHTLDLNLSCAAASLRSDTAPSCEAVPPCQREQFPPSIPSLSYFAAANSSSCSSRRSSLRDQNSVTIKATTVVKDAAGAIDKILSRGVTALVTALRSGVPPYQSAYDSLNQAVKAIAVARQYAKETGPEGSEVTFLPFHRYDTNERADPGRFAFLVFPVPRVMERLKTADETVLNVARGSDVQKMAGAIIAVMLDRGQAVMKAAGSEAIFVAMSAVVNARHRLVVKHGFDLMLAASWITEDTVSTMGRESKFLRFNILKTEPAGPKSSGLPSLPALLEAR